MCLFPAQGAGFAELVAGFVPVGRRGARPELRFWGLGITGDEASLGRGVWLADVKEMRSGGHLKVLGDIRKRTLRLQKFSIRELVVSRNQLFGAQAPLGKVVKLSL